MTMEQTHMADILEGENQLTLHTPKQTHLVLCHRGQCLQEFEEVDQ